MTLLRDEKGRFVKGSRAKDDERVILDNTDRSGDCWLWTAYVGPRGYGRTARNRRSMLAHRLSYEVFVGAIPDGLTIDHLCRVRHCVNPDHLEAVTHRVNILRGTSPVATHARKTHCVRGHPLDGVLGNGRRYCLTCNRLRAAANRAKRQDSTYGRGQ